GSGARFGWQAAVSQRLPWFGKRELEVRAAAAEARAAEEDFEATRRELALGAVTLFEQYYVAVRSIEVNAAHVELMQAMQRAAVAQYAPGRGSVQASLAAEAELTHMEHEAFVSASRRDVVVAQMNELLHRPPHLALPPPPRELPPCDVPDARAVARFEADAAA